jgi:Uridine kinase
MYVIGITGGTCSGKTTLTQALADKLIADGYAVKVIHMDSYFKNPTPTVIAPFTGIEYSEHNHPDSFRMQEFYDAVDEAVKGDETYLFLEGLLVLHLEYIRNKLDLKLFIDLQSDERLVRRIKRFQKNNNQTLEEISDRFLDTVRYRHAEFVEPSRWYADLVINGCFNLNNGTDIICDYIKLKGGDKV